MWLHTYKHIDMTTDIGKLNEFLHNGALKPKLEFHLIER